MWTQLSLQHIKIRATGCWRHLRTNAHLIHKVATPGGVVPLLADTEGTAPATSSRTAAKAADMLGGVGATAHDENRSRRGANITSCIAGACAILRRPRPRSSAQWSHTNGRLTSRSCRRSQLLLHLHVECVLHPTEPAMPRAKKGSNSALIPAAAPLPVFWACLDAQSKRSLLRVSVDSVSDVPVCSGCRRLLRSAWAPADEASASVAASAPPAPEDDGGPLLPPTGPFTLLRLADASYVTEDTRSPYSPEKVLEYSFTAGEFWYSGPIGTDILRLCPRINGPPKAYAGGIIVPTDGAVGADGGPRLMARNARGAPDDAPSGTGYAAVASVRAGASSTTAQRVEQTRADAFATGVVAPRTGPPAADAPPSESNAIAADALARWPASASQPQTCWYCYDKVRPP